MCHTLSLENVVWFVSFSAFEGFDPLGPTSNKKRIPHSSLQMVRQVVFFLFVCLSFCFVLFCWITAHEIAWGSKNHNLKGRMLPGTRNAGCRPGRQVPTQPSCADKTVLQRQKVQHWHHLYWMLTTLFWPTAKTCKTSVNQNDVLLAFSGGISLQ